jgi:biotin transport system substrate-specific component
MLFSSRINSHKLTKILSGVFLLFAFSQIVIPLDPIPITLQSLAVLLIGITYDKSSGLTTVLIYLVLGFLGVPVFAGMKSGLGGPSAGYLFGFLFAIYLMNKSKEKFGLTSYYAMTFTLLLGLAGIFLLGIIWLSSFIGLRAAIKVGLIPFIIPGLVKTFLLLIILRMINFSLNKR